MLQGPTQHMQAEAEDVDPSENALFSLATPAELERPRTRGRPPAFLKGPRVPNDDLQLLASAASSANESDQVPEPESIGRLPPARRPSLPRIQTPESGRLVPQSTTGYDNPDTMLLAIGELQAFLETHECNADEEVTKLARFYLDPQQFHMTSGALRRSMLNLSRGGLDSKHLRLASCLSLHHRLAMVDSIHKIVQYVPPSGLLYFVDFVAYDETPMVCSVKDEFAHPLLHDLRELHAHRAPDRDLLQDLQRVLGKGRYDAVVAKILQTRGSYGMVLQVRPGQHMILVGDMLNNVAAMGKASAEVLAKCLLRAGSLPVAVNKFQTHCRASCSDKAGYNVRAESLIRELRGARSSSFHVHCDIHCIATAMSRTMALISDDIKGILRIGLSLQVGSHMSCFRQAITEVVRERVVICVGQLPSAARAYKMHMLQLFHNSLTHKSKSLVLLLEYLNGDWRNTLSIEYYKDKPKSMQDREEVIRVLTAVILEVYASTRPPLYPRHRWTGADEAVDWVASFQSIHGLFRVVYLKFLTLCGKAAPATAQDSAAPSLTIAEFSEHSVPEHGALADVSVFAGLGSGERGASFSDAGAPEYAEQLAQHRKLAQAWLARDPSTSLYAMRTVMQPILELLYSEFHVTSPEFELLEEAKACSAHLHDQDGVPLTPRAFKLTECAHQVNERDFFKKLHTLFVDREAWQHMPAVGKTAEWGCRVFRLLSRAGCLIQELFAHKHTLFPYCMFKLVHDQSAADEMRNQSTCKMDPWSLEMFHKYENWASGEFHLVLLLMCSLVTTNISDIEARHATMRRHLTSSSTQVRRMSFVDLGANWVFQQYRRCKLMCGATRPRPGKNKV